MEEKNITPVTPNNWTNPSIGQSVDNSLREEVNELRNEVNELKEEISKLNGEENTIETPKVEEPIVETKEETNIEVPFVESPFTEAVSEETPVVEEPTKEEVPVETQITNEMKDILDSVKEEVPTVEVEEPVPSFDDMLVEEDTEKLSIVVNRYNTDIVATTQGKGAKFITLTDDEQSKLLSGKIN